MVKPFGIERERNHGSYPSLSVYTAEQYICKWDLPAGLNFLPNMTSGWAKIGKAYQLTAYIFYE